MNEKALFAIGVSRLHLVALAILAVSLSGCLPDSESVREKRLQDFSTGEAASFATALSSYSTQSHGALLRNAAFLNGTLAQGEVGRSLDHVLAHGYCREGGGGDVNHMLVSWYTQTDRDGEFTVKGIGKGAGASIVQALSTHAPPQMIGYFGDREVRLRGPRRNGRTELSLPAGCDLDIPAGAPVLVMEHISPADQVGLGGGSYEYRTVSCEDASDIGARTERRTVRTQDDGAVIRGAWEMYDDACGGTVSTRAVSIERSIGNLIGALDLTDTGSLQNALSGLAELDCVRVRTGEVQTDAAGNGIEAAEEIADTCDTNNIDITKYESDKDMARTDEVRSREVLAVSCGRGQSGTYPRGQHNASYKGYTGSLSIPGGWNGTATYERFTFNAEQQSGGQSAVDGMQKGLWQGDTLHCTRYVVLTVDCYDVFPEYRGLDPVTLGGMSVRRTNRIIGWAVKSPPSPNKPLNDDTGWFQYSAACEWKEQGSYSCCEKLGEDWALSSAGSRERNIVGTSIKSVGYTSWKDLGPASCQKPYDYYWDDCTTTCTGTGEEQECTETCVTRHEIRYYHASTSLTFCEGGSSSDGGGGGGEEEEENDSSMTPEEKITCTAYPDICDLYQLIVERYPESDGAEFWASELSLLLSAYPDMAYEDALAKVEMQMRRTPEAVAIANGLDPEAIRDFVNGFVPDEHRANITVNGDQVCTTGAGGVDCADLANDPVRALYVAVFHRMPDEEGYEHWQGAYEAGTVTISELITEFQQSPEGQEYAQQIQRHNYANEIVTTYVQETGSLPDDSAFNQYMAQADETGNLETVLQQIAEDTAVPVY